MSIILVPLSDFSFCFVSSFCLPLWLFCFRMRSWWVVCVCVFEACVCVWFCACLQVGFHAYVLMSLRSAYVRRHVSIYVKNLYVFYVCWIESMSVCLNVRFYEMSFILTTSRWAGGCGGGCLAASLSSLFQLCPPCRHTHYTHPHTNSTGGQMYCKMLSCTAQQREHKRAKSIFASLLCNFLVTGFFQSCWKAQFGDVGCDTEASLLWQWRDAPPAVFWTR